MLLVYVKTKKDIEIIILKLMCQSVRLLCYYVIVYFVKEFEYFLYSINFLLIIKKEYNLMYNQWLHLHVLEEDLGLVTDNQILLLYEFYKDVELKTNKNQQIHLYVHALRYPMTYNLSMYYNNQWLISYKPMCYMKHTQLHKGYGVRKKNTTIRSITILNQCGE